VPAACACRDTCRSTHVAPEVADATTDASPVQNAPAAKQAATKTPKRKKATKPARPLNGERFAPLLSWRPILDSIRTPARTFGRPGKR
jgi:hypothetical protein